MSDDRVGTFKTIGIAVVTAFFVAVGGWLAGAYRDEVVVKGAISSQNEKLREHETRLTKAEHDAIRVSEQLRGMKDVQDEFRAETNAKLERIERLLRRER